jgi:hypothetical protein
MIEWSPKLFTAAQIARAFGKSPAAIRQALTLANVAPRGTIIAAGNPANAWEFSTLPESMRVELARRAQRQGYRDALHLLSAPTEAWRPAVSISECVPADIEKAQKLRRAFAGTLQRIGNSNLSAGEMEWAGVADYAREFGHAITERRWRDLFRRLLDRDRGQEQYERLELYLDDSARRAAPSPAQDKNPWEEVLGDYLGKVATPGALSRSEEEYVWLVAMERLSAESDRPAALDKLKRRLGKYLLAEIPAIAATADGLRKQIARKWTAWQETGGNARAIRDKRAAEFRGVKKLPEADLLKTAAHIVLKAEGRVSQGVRELNQAGQLPDSISIPADAKSKSYVPSAARKQLQPLVNELMHWHRGQRRGSGAHLERDWSNVFAGDFFSADDCTLPVYVWTIDQSGRKVLTRGQFLPMIDERSLRILSFVFVPTPSYNSFAIRSLMTRTCMAHGLPRVGFLYERGIWANARLITGRNAGARWEDVELGFAQFANIRFIHARAARVKVVETVLRLFQNKLGGEPGYVGRDERRIEYLHVQKAKIAVEAGREAAEEHFYSVPEWIERLEEICRVYNADPQQGKMLDGFSPDQGFQAFARHDDPLLKLGPELRYLLANHCIPIREVSREGVKFTLGGKLYKYNCETTGPLINHSALAWFDPENPETVVLTDLNKRNAVAAHRLPDVPAHDGGELLNQGQRQIAEHHKHHKGIYRTIATEHAPQFRKVQPDLNSALMAIEGDGIESARASAEVARKEQEQDVTKIQALARSAGLRSAVTNRATEKGTRDLLNFLNQNNEGSEAQP